MSRGSASIVEDGSNFSFLSLDITPAPHPFASRPIDNIQSPETPHPNLHSRQRSESRQLLPESKELFKYSNTTYFDFGVPGRNQNIQDEHHTEWSDEPRYLSLSGMELVRDIAVDVVIVMLPLSFFALAGAMVC